MSYVDYSLKKEIVYKVFINCYGRAVRNHQKGGRHERDNEGETEWD